MLTEDAGRIPVVVGPCGAGRTSLLHRLHADFGPTESQYVNVERTATTPERFLAALTGTSPFLDIRSAAVALNPRQAFDAVLAFLAGAHGTEHGPATFLLDEALEFRTFESFPGLAPRDARTAGRRRLVAEPFRPHVPLCRPDGPGPVGRVAEVRRHADAGARPTKNSRG